MRLFLFWAGMFVMFACWNTIKYNGYDPLEMMKDIYVKPFVEMKEEKVWPDTFEHHHKRTE